MRRAYNKMSVLSSILALTGGVDPNTGETKTPPKQRFILGDKFYLGLNYKRVNGKWTVKN